MKKRVRPGQVKLSTTAQDYFELEPNSVYIDENKVYYFDDLELGSVHSLNEYLEECYYQMMEEV